MFLQRLERNRIKRPCRFGHWCGRLRCLEWSAGFGTLGDRICSYPETDSLNAHDEGYFAFGCYAGCRGAFALRSGFCPDSFQNHTGHRQHALGAAEKSDGVSCLDIADILQNLTSCLVERMFCFSKVEMAKLPLVSRG